MDLLDALGQAGTAIDKFTGGRALRGGLAGKPRELLSVLPFSDSLGLTDERDATSGRDLTDAYGITSKGADDFGAHALGFLADNVLSPGNVLGGVAAYKAAPTIGKGLVAGVKALSGLDLLDQLKGLKGLGHAAEGMGDVAGARLDRLVGHDPSPYARGAGAGDLFEKLMGRPAGMAAPPTSAAIGEAMPPHQMARARAIVDDAGVAARARQARPNLYVDALNAFLGG